MLGVLYLYCCVGFSKYRVLANGITVYGRHDNAILAAPVDSNAVRQNVILVATRPYQEELNFSGPRPVAAVPKSCVPLDMDELQLDGEAGPYKDDYSFLAPAATEAHVQTGTPFTGVESLNTSYGSRLETMRRTDKYFYPIHLGLL